jgi:hypothetical protein
MSTAEENERTNRAFVTAFLEKYDTEYGRVFGYYAPATHAPDTLEWLWTDGRDMDERLFLVWTNEPKELTVAITDRESVVPNTREYVAVPCRTARQWIDADEYIPMLEQGYAVNDIDERYLFIMAEYVN